MITLTRRYRALYCLKIFSAVLSVPLRPLRFELRLTAENTEIPTFG